MLLISYYNSLMIVKILLKTYFYLFLNISTCFLSFVFLFLYNNIFLSQSKVQKTKSRLSVVWCKEQPFVLIDDPSSESFSAMFNILSANKHRSLKIHFHTFSFFFLCSVNNFLPPKNIFVNLLSLLSHYGFLLERNNYSTLMSL